MAGDLEFVDDLCKSIDGVVKSVVEAMHEHQRLGAFGLFRHCGHGIQERLPINILCRDRNEIAIGVAGRRRGPLHFSDLTIAVGWN